MFLESRRNFLKGTAATIGSVAVAKGVFSTIVTTEAVASSEFSNTPKSLEFYPPLSQWDNFNELDGEDWKRGGINRHPVGSKNGTKVNNFMIVPTACNNCEASCGLTAWIDKETMVVKKYMGNPLHAGSRGRNCAKGYAALSQMYDPDRIPFPLKRATGAKRGEGKWVRTTWDEALSTIGAKIRKTLENTSPTDINRKMVMYHVGRPNENGFTPRVWHTLGVDSTNSHTNICSSNGRTGNIAWTNDDRTSPDWGKSKLMLLISSHAADAGHYFQQSAGFIAEARQKGGKLVVLDPRMSNSAGISDLWIAPWPGTEGALFLSLIHKLLVDKKANFKYMKKWMNWETLLHDEEYLDFLVSKGFIKAKPEEKSFEVFVEILKELYKDFTFEYASKETKVPLERIHKLYDMVVEAGDKISMFFWRATAAGNRGGWMSSGKTGWFLLAVTGSINAVGGTLTHHDHVISIGGRGGDATVAKTAPKVDVYNEITWPPEWPLSTYELSYLLPHLLSDTEWQQKWNKRGLQVPQKLSVWIAKQYNPVWINPDGFRWLEVLKDESKMELTVQVTPTWAETSWYLDYLLPVGLAGERHDQHSEATLPGAWTSFRQPVLRVALEKMGWKPKDPSRATLEAHIKAGLGEIWEENEFWINLAFAIDPDGKLGIRQYWESKRNPAKPVTIAEYYDAAFSLLPKLKEAAYKTYPNAEFPVYEFMRDRGTWLEEDNIYNMQEKELKYNEEKHTYKSHGKEYHADEVKKDDVSGVLYVEHDDEKHSIGIEIDGKKYEGFATEDKKLNFFTPYFVEYHWPEYAIPNYPRNEKEHEEMIHVVTHVHHKYMKEENSFALNTIYRLPYNIHTRSANSKHLMEISQNHNPIWISTVDANRLGFKKGDAIRVRIVDTVSGLDSGYFVAMAVPTEGILPGTLACSHHAGRWKLKNSIKVEGFEHELGIIGFGAPLAQLSMDGKKGELKYIAGAKPDTSKIWQFKE